MGAADDFRVLLEPGAIRAVFQPIVRLVRPGDDRLRGPGALPHAARPGRAAARCDARRRGARRAARRPRGRLLARDRRRRRPAARAAAVGQPVAGGARPPGLLELAGKLPSRLVIELTEQDTVLNHALLRERLRPWIARGALVAVDDAGAGFTSLEYVADIRPDFLKLSRGMVAGVDRDATREAVLRATAAFAREVGARVVAEGVERSRSSRRCARWRSTTARAGCSAAPARRGRATSRRAPQPRPPRRGRGPAGARPRARRARRATRARRSSTTSPAAACCRSIYLAQDGRLRCQAVRGVWQVFDGLPADDRHRRPRLPHRHAGDRRRRRRGAGLPARDPRRARRGLPPAARRRPGRRRARRRVADRDRRRDRRRRSSAAPRCCRRGWRTSAPSAPPRPRSGSRAPRPGSPSTEDPEGVVREALAAALELSGYESGVVALADGHGALYPHLAEGPFGVAFSQLASEELAAMASWVDDGTSTYTVGDTAGRGFVGHEVLRRAGHRLADRAAAERRRRPPRADRGRRPREPPPGVRGHRAARAARPAGRQRPADGVDDLPAARARLPRPADRPARVAAAAARPRRRRDARRRRPRRRQRHRRPGRGRRRPARHRRAAARADAPGLAGLPRSAPTSSSSRSTPQRASAAEHVGWELRAQAPLRIGRTVSVGVAVGGEGEAGEAVVLRAGVALDAVKRAGADGVAIA